MIAKIMQKRGLLTVYLYFEMLDSQFSRNKETCLTILALCDNILFTPTCYDSKRSKQRHSDSLLDIVTISFAEKRERNNIFVTITDNTCIHLILEWPWALNTTRSCSMAIAISHNDYPTLYFILTIVITILFFSPKSSHGYHRWGKVLLSCQGWTKTARQKLFGGDWDRIGKLGFTCPTFGPRCLTAPPTILPTYAHM